MYKWQGEGVGIPGIGAVDMSDEEFLAAAIAYDAQFPDEPAGLLERSGLWRYYGKASAEDRIDELAAAEAEEGSAT